MAAYNLKSSFNARVLLINLRTKYINHISSHLIAGFTYSETCFFYTLILVS